MNQCVAQVSSECTKEGQEVFLLARVGTLDKPLIEAIDVQSILYTIYDVTSARLQVKQGSYDVPSAILPGLTLDDLWDVDVIGYNVRLTLLNEWMPMSDDVIRTFHVEVVLTSVTGQVLVLSYVFERQPTHSVATP